MTTYRTAGSLAMTLPAPDLTGVSEVDFLAWMRSHGWVISEPAFDPGGEERDSRYVRHPDHPGVLLAWTADVWQWESGTALPRRLGAMYASLGFIHRGAAQPLHQSCAHAHSCWSGHEDRIPIGDKLSCSHLSYPWIGSRFGALRIAVVGINPNEAGGLDLYPGLVREAQDELRQGKTRVTFGVPGYGTLYWHRVGLYAAAAAQTLRRDQVDCALITPDQAFEWIALLNQIKCSPIGDRSQPSPSMWTNCGHHVLRQELDILAPRLLVVVGTGDNLWGLSQYVLDQEPILLGGNGRAKAFQGKLHNRCVGVVAVPHPASFRGADRTIATDLAAVVREHRNDLGFRPPF